MPLLVRWSEAALGRVEQILDYVAVDDPGAAVELVERIFDASSHLADQPHIGSWYAADSRHGLRQLLVGPYRLVYLVDEPRELVHIVAVRHVRQAPLSPDQL